MRRTAALEAIAYAWDEMRRIPARAYWEKPQGKNEPLKMEKRYAIVPRGVGLVIGCNTFPTWNGYPGMFASLATGNAVIVKPHPNAILPLAISVQIAREVLAEAGFDPNVVTLVAHAAGDDTAQKLALRPEVKLIDFTGSSAHGNWLERNAHQAQVYTEKAGVNQIVIDSADDFAGVARNIAFSLALYTGQMCTAPQNIYVPRDGIETGDGHLSFDQVAAGPRRRRCRSLSAIRRARWRYSAPWSTMASPSGSTPHARWARSCTTASRSSIRNFPQARIATPLHRQARRRGHAQSI